MNSYIVFSLFCKYLVCKLYFTAMGNKTNDDIILSWLEDNADN